MLPNASAISQNKKQVESILSHSSLVLYRWQKEFRVIYSLKVGCHLFLVVLLLSKTRHCARSGSGELPTVFPNFLLGHKTSVWNLIQMAIPLEFDNWEITGTSSSDSEIEGAAKCLSQSAETVQEVACATVNSRRTEKLKNVMKRSQLKLTLDVNEILHKQNDNFLIPISHT